MPSSRIVLGAPRVLGFDYMEWIAACLREPRTVVHLGGAGCSLPRYCADVWPDSRNTVVEIDGALSELTRSLFDVPAHFHTGDARTYIHSLSPGSVDAIIRDVFAGPTTPRHVTTVEFYQAAQHALSPGGVYVANIGDRAGLAETREELAGMLKVFPHVGALSTPEMLTGNSYGNVVVWGSDRAVEPSEVDGVRHAAAAWVSTMTEGIAPRRD
nr:spermidine synthase [Streptococcus thermophilus]